VGRTFLITACCWICSLLLAAAQNAGRQSPRSTPATVAEKNPYATAADLALGRKLYVGRCGHCHGQDGEGGRGAVLNSGRFRSGGSDRELFVTIRSGIPNSEMPGAPNLAEADVWRLVAYVQQLGRQGAADVSPGDPAAGALVYQTSGCASCHRINNQGGFFGPDLTDVGVKRAARYLRESIVDPSADIPLDYRPVAVIDRTGNLISGIHLNEDEYSIHLRDLGGNLRSFMKSEVGEIRLPRQSLMPAYPSLSSTDLENLVAYLKSLQPARYADRAGVELWTFDRLENIGGHKTIVLGRPRIIDSPVGRAVEFDGVQDALFIEHHPLAGAETFTWEAIFRPDGGQREQRWFHLSEQDPETGADTENRLLFEIRVVGDQWFLDSYSQSGAASKALMNRGALHALGAWYHVAAVYTGTEFSNYVDGVREGAAELHLAPHRPGHSSVGVRINRVFYFRGAVRLARFTRRALSPAEFLRVESR
jgi:putative heme-binding domain-containing protein